MSRINEDTIVLVLSIAVLAFVTGRWIHARMLRKHAQNWPAAIGAVESTDLRMERRGGGQSIHVAEVIYGYEAMGKSYHGRWMRHTILYGKAKRWIDSNPPGQRIWVRYNPENAGASIILEPDQGLAK